MTLMTYLMILAIVGAVGGFCVYMSQPRPNKPPAVKTVGMYGDSITGGDGLTMYGDSITGGDGLNPRPVARMTELAKGAWVGLDYSLGGSTVMDAVAGTDPRMPFGPWAKHMKIDTSSVIVIGYAGATALRNPDKIDEYERLLEQMVDQAQETGKTVILKGMSHVPELIKGYSNTDSIRLYKALADFDQRTREIAARLGLRFVDLRLLPFAGQSDLMDEVHPNQAYSDRIGAFTVSAINQALMGDPH